MPKTTPLVLAALLAGRLTPALAQNTPDENNPNFDAPFVQHIRPDRPGQTITAGVLRAGEFQLETGVQRYSPGRGAGGLSSSTATLRIGFFNSMEFRVTQPYVYGTPRIAAGGEHPALRPDSVGWAPLTVGTKLMLTPDRASRFQASLLIEAALPNTGSAGLRRGSLAPSGRLLLSQQLGRRAALEGNFGFTQYGLTAADVSRGQYLGSLALTAPITDRAGYFVEGYGRGREQFTTGGTAGLYYRPWTGLRFDATVGRVLGGLDAGATTVGVGVALRLGSNSR
jgi:hypothetical protein